ncbi:MAG: adenylate kinase, partial [Planctomycetes bacterium]|nr:adenylate kinase [Planctomycetota bacterium]
LTHLSSGDILRAERASKTELGRKAQNFMDSGGLVPDDVIISMMVTAIGKAGGGCVLDGFPRTVVQAEELDKSLTEGNKKIDAVVNLVIDDDVVAHRLTGRRSCPECGAIYHIEALRPKVEGICDKCGKALMQRSDDKPDVVKNRLRTYHAQTAAVVGYYQKVDKTIFDINADGSVEEITTAIFEKLDKLATV